MSKFDNIEMGDVFIFTKDYKVYSTSSSYGSRTYTIMLKGNKIVYLYKNDTKRYLFAIEENYNNDLKNGSDHHVDINMIESEMLQYIETKNERRKRIIKEIL